MRKRYAIVLTVLLLLAFAGGAALWFVNAARWLERPDAPAAADAIVVLAGSYRRPLHAAELFRKGLAPVVYVSVPAPDPSAALLAPLGVQLVPQEQTYEQTLRALGVPAAGIQRLGSGSLSTFDEATAARKRFTQPGVRLLIVTSPFHVRRVRMVFADAFAGSGARIAVLANPHEPIPERWWASQDAARDVLLEWAKILFYATGGRFSAAAP